MRRDDYSKPEEMSSAHKSRFSLIGLNIDPATIPRRKGPEPGFRDADWTAEDREAFPEQQHIGCDIDGITYDDTWRTGRLFMAPDHSCDMAACIELFKTIDLQVRRIETFSGDNLDTCYWRENHRWYTESDGVLYS